MKKDFVGSNIKMGNTSSQIYTTVEWERGKDERKNYELSFVTYLPTASQKAILYLILDLS